jgi:asparagine synthase (glutamine-hydrolysing)
MDSSAVTILAAQRSTQPITTISNRYPVVETCDEGRYIEAVTRSVHSKHVERPADDVGPLAAFESSAKDWPGPTVGGNFYLVERMFDIAKSCHIDVMLDGFDGDTVVSHGWQRFAELALDGRWTELGVEALAIERRGGPSFLDIQRSFTYPALSKMVRNGHVLAAIGGLHTLARDSQRYSALGLGRDAFRRHRASRSATGGTDWMEYLRPDAVRRYQPTAIEPDPLQSALDRHRADIMMPFWSTALEALHHMGERAGVENRHPFLDRQLVEFCVALPASAKLRDGWTRRILRDALRDDYPPEIRQRTDKANLTPAFLHGLVEFDRPRVEHYLGRPLERLGALVEVERVRTAARAITGGAGTSGVEAMKVWTVLSAAVWMDANDRDLS